MAECPRSPGSTARRLPADRGRWRSRLERIRNELDAGEPRPDPGRDPEQERLARPLRADARGPPGAAGPPGARPVHRGHAAGAAAGDAAPALPAPGAGRGAGTRGRTTTATPRGWGATPRVGRVAVDPADRAGRPRGSRASGRWAWPRRAGPASDRAQVAQDEISEMIAFVEDMPLRWAVKRLELALRGPRPARRSSSAVC